MLLAVVLHYVAVAAKSDSLCLGIVAIVGMFCIHDDIATDKSKPK